MISYRTKSAGKRCIAFSLIAVLICLVFSGCEETKTNAVDYENKTNWAYYEADKRDVKADVFFICPTIYFGDEKNYNMPLDDDAAKENFYGAINMEKGIYDENSRFFAPYYKQIGLNVYEMEQNVQEKYLSIAYEDVKAAFTYYLKNVNNGNPIILAGFSQGQICVSVC